MAVQCRVDKAHDIVTEEHNFERVSNTEDVNDIKTYIGKYIVPYILSLSCVVFISRVES